VHCFARGAYNAVKMALAIYVSTKTNIEIIPDIAVSKSINYIFFQDCVRVSSTSSNMEVDVPNVHISQLYLSVVADKKCLVIVGLINKCR